MFTNIIPNFNQRHCTVLLISFHYRMMGFTHLVSVFASLNFSSRFSVKPTLMARKVVPFTHQYSTSPTAVNRSERKTTEMDVVKNCYRYSTSSIRVRGGSFFFLVSWKNYLLVTRFPSRRNGGQPRPNGLWFPGPREGQRGEDPGVGFSIARLRFALIFSYGFTRSVSSLLWAFRTIHAECSDKGITRPREININSVYQYRALSMRSGKSEEAAITRRINRNERLCGASITENGPTDLHWIGPKANHLFLVAAPRRPSSPSADPLNWRLRLPMSALRSPLQWRLLFRRSAARALIVNLSRQLEGPPRQFLSPRRPDFSSDVRPERSTRNAADSILFDRFFLTSGQTRAGGRHISRAEPPRNANNAQYFHTF
ncbi:unnamed protein product [Nesidiocoris tenuis]|uniref:Uncharacterized protein n=1 Tax=Nesidiocoris tenuis TaxID=355587 RepID=A0A6H5GHB3_9HEMI|nr:unnamed protein product [Nesidiocoris tenuis]